MSRTRDWDREQYPEADHVLTDAEIEEKYGDLIAEFILDVATASDFATLTKMAANGERRAR